MTLHQFNKRKKIIYALVIINAIVFVVLSLFFLLSDSENKSFGGVLGIQDVSIEGHLFSRNNYDEYEVIEFGNGQQVVTEETELFFETGDFSVAVVPERKDDQDERSIKFILDNNDLSLRIEQGSFFVEANSLLNINIESIDQHLLVPSKAKFFVSDGGTFTVLQGEVWTDEGEVISGGQAMDWRVDRFYRDNVDEVNMEFIDIQRFIEEIELYNS